MGSNRLRYVLSYTHGFRISHWLAELQYTVCFNSAANGVK
jgi:hypothetical protein